MPRLPAKAPSSRSNGALARTNADTSGASARLPHVLPWIDLRRLLPPNDTREFVGCKVTGVKYILPTAGDFGVALADGAYGYDWRWELQPAERTSAQGRGLAESFGDGRSNQPNEPRHKAGGLRDRLAMGVATSRTNPGTRPGACRIG